MDQCPECGADVEASASYCFNCGEDLSNGGDPSVNRALDDQLIDVEYELDKAYDKIERLERGNARLRKLLAQKKNASGGRGRCHRIPAPKNPLKHVR